MRAYNWRRVVLWCICALIVVGIVGTWFHTSDDPTILGKYSFNYFATSCSVTVGGIFAVFCAWIVLTPQQLVFRSGRIVIPSTPVKLLSVVVLIVSPVAVIEVGLTRVKSIERGARAGLAEFHPFLQNAPVPGDREKSINRWGFRGEEIDLVKPADAYRIFVLGGSTVYCGEVKYEQTHCRLLEKSLRQAYPYAKIEVQNAGVPWYTSQHSLISFLTKVEDFNPDLVIVFQGANDIARGFSPPYAAEGEYQPDYRHFYGPVATMVRTYAAEPGRFHLYVSDVAWKFVSQQWFSDLRGTSIPAQPVVRRPWTEWKSLPSFKRNMRNLVAIVRSKHIELIIASQPYMLEGTKTGLTNALVRNEYDMPDLPSLVNGMDLFNQTSKAVADEYDTTFVDLEKQIPKTSEYFIDEFHFTPKGNQVVAAAFNDAIVAHGLVDKKFSQP